MIDADEARRSILSMDRLIVAIKATGGYKYRAYVEMPAAELDRYVASCVPTLRGMALRLLAAEDVIARYGHEYDYKLTMQDVARLVDAKPAPPIVRPPMPPRPPNRAARRRDIRMGKGAVA